MNRNSSYKCNLAHVSQICHYLKYFELHVWCQKDSCILTPAGNQAPCSCSLSPNHCDGGENQKSKSEKTCQLRQRLIGKAKGHTSKATQGINSLLAMGRQVFSRTDASRAPSLVTVIWKDKYHHSKCPHLPSSLRLTC